MRAEGLRARWPRASRLLPGRDARAPRRRRCPDEESASSARAFTRKYGSVEDAEAFETLSWTTRRTPAFRAALRRVTVLSRTRSNVTVPRGQRIQYVL